MLTSFPKVPKTASESPANHRLQLLHCHMMHRLQGTPWMSPYTLYCQKLQSLRYIIAADSVGLSSFKFSWWAPKMHVFWNIVQNGRSRSPKVIDFSTNRKRVCNFLLVSIVTLVLSCPISELLHVFYRECWPHPYSTQILVVFPLDQIAAIGSPRSVDPKVIIRVITFELTQHIHPLVHQRYGWMDRQTDDLR